MELKTVLQKRTSYRGDFTDDPVSRSDLREIVQAGILAPSGYGAETTEFVVVDDREMILRIETIIGERPVLATAKALIVVVMDPNATDDRDYSFGVEDYSAATENMLLSIVDHGYASVWLDGALKRGTIAADVASFLDVPASRSVRVVLPVGVPRETPKPKEKKRFEERAWFGRYGTIERS